jgi:hypothetical protein
MSDCNVCLGSDIECYAEFYEGKTVTAKKDHKCTECRETIAKGTQYLRECGKWDGEFSSFHTCLICAELRTAFSCQDGQAICFGELWNEIEEYLFPEMTTGCLEKCKTAAAKQFLIDRWNKWKFRGR